LCIFPQHNKYLTDGPVLSYHMHNQTHKLPSNTEEENTNISYPEVIATETPSKTDMASLHLHVPHFLQHNWL
jgi:hypothetical protein